jgi:alkylhydroperoxidase/carboxymuconolactone decarboxylase family protein YurZ
MTSAEKPIKLSFIGSVLDSDDAQQAAGGAASAFYDAVDSFWSAVYKSPHLTARMKELILLALHAAPSALNEAAINRQVQRALSVGASESDIADVLVTIIPLANHPLYTGIPILMEELLDAGLETECVVPEMPDGVRALKDDFIERRGYWTEKRDLIGRWMPDYFISFINACMEPWQSGSLTPAERELMYIAIDCSITHTYEAGLRMHIQNALRYGATRDQILEVFQLAGLLGTEGYVLGIKCLRKKA